MLINISSPDDFNHPFTRRQKMHPCLRQPDGSNKGKKLALINQACILRQLLFNFEQVAYE